jgi:DNA-binding CsgD family transcriptional regulator
MPVFPKPDQAEKNRESSRPNSFIFCERATGVAQFGAVSDSDVNFTIERAAGLLAMQCLARGIEPSDFAILAPVEKMLAERMVARAKELLDHGRSASNPTQLSPRQQQILHSVICNRENKEIASKLNITVRTVKFHISSLLSKFGVDNRAELARRAASMLRCPILADEPYSAPQNSEAPQRRGPQSIPMQAESQMAHKGRSIRFPGRVMSA